MMRTHGMLKVVFFFASLLTAPVACTQETEDPGPDDEGNEPSLVVGALPEGADVVGSCQVPAGARVCELYFNPGIEQWTEEEAYEDCRGVDTADTWSDDFWHPGEACPEESLRSVCVYAYRAEFQYKQHPRDIDESRQWCEIDGATFIVF